MRIGIHRHQNKADRLIAAIEAQGHIVSNEPPLDLILLDHDGPDYYRNMIAHADKHGIKVGLYSHGATSYVAWDGLWEPHPSTAFYLAASYAEKAVMECYGYHKPIYPIGWFYSPVRPYTPSTGRKVLFAPIHLLGNGFIPKPAYEANRRTFERLLDETFDLTVYHLGDLEAQGVKRIPGVRYLESTGTNRTDIFERFDCVVSYGTFAYNAIAYGVPTYVYGQDIPPWDGYTDDTVRYAANYGCYKYLMDFPYDLDYTESMFAWNKPAALDHWKAAHIGQAFDPVAFVKLLEALC